jgi:hypothetical protein
MLEIMSDARSALSRLFARGQAMHEDGAARGASARNSNNPWVIIIGTGALAVFAIALVASLIDVWPAIEAGTSSLTAGASTAATTRPAGLHHVTLFFGLVTVTATPSVTLLLLVILMGALGSVVHSATSFADFVGNRRFFSSWIAWYLLRPVVGALLALLMYFAVRGGFFSTSSQNDSVNPYGIAALAGLAGLFSKQATDKLREVFETLFKVSSTDGDAQRRDGLDYEKPTVDEVVPPQATVGARGVKLRIHGEHFTPATVVKVKGTALPTSFVNAQELEVNLPDELLAIAGSLSITVGNPAPGGNSEPVAFLVVPPTAA